MFDKTLEEAAANGDGTFSGLKTIQWLHHAMTGKPLSDDEAKNLLDEAQERIKKKKEDFKNNERKIY
jgi:hypothetical protein